MTGFHVLVQSENDSVYLENRIEAFLSDTLKKHIEELSEEDFEKRSSLFTLISSHTRPLVEVLLTRLDLGVFAWLGVV
jgi:secreted Zn-dependent insulinase-like peptidase